MHCLHAIACKMWLKFYQIFLESYYSLKNYLKERKNTLKISGTPKFHVTNFDSSWNGNPFPPILITHGGERGLGGLCLWNRRVNQSRTNPRLTGSGECLLCILYGDIYVLFLWLCDAPGRAKGPWLVGTLHFLRPHGRAKCPLDL